MEPRKRKRLLLAFTGIAALVAGLLLFLNRNDEPTFEGIPLSTWLLRYSFRYVQQSDAERAKTELAIRTIGTNATPWLLEWLSSPQATHWRENLLMRLPARIQNSPTATRLVLGRSAVLGNQAVSAFELLGTNAVPATAIPSLEALMNNKAKDGRYLRAIVALGYLGEPGFIALTNAFANPQPMPMHRVAIVLSLRGNALSSPDGINRCLPVLLQALTDQDTGVQMAAKTVLRGVAPEALANATAK